MWLTSLVTSIIAALIVQAILFGVARRRARSSFPEGGTHRMSRSLFLGVFITLIPWVAISPFLIGFHMVAANMVIITGITIAMAAITTSGRGTALLCVLFLHFINLLVLLILKTDYRFSRESEALVAIGALVVPFNMIVAPILARRPDK